MVKADFSRDYYGDLELPPTADAEAIKKQYRKLAMKYHPDRNIGKEKAPEFNQKFQIIQEAHEVLSNAEQKSKYDQYRRSRFPTASGVRGNPWQDVGKNYPPPPKPPTRPQRPPMHRTQQSSGADRYASFAKDVPPMPPRYQAKASNASSYYKAWENMKSGARSHASAGASTKASGSGANIKKPADPPNIPRTNSQRQPKGSFGARVYRGFTPQSPSGDEPAVGSNNYFTTRTHTNLFNETASSTRAYRRAPSNLARDSSFMDTRQSTPYQTHGGEKLNPFDGANINRSKSTREPYQSSSRASREASQSPTRRQRASSVPDDSDSTTRASKSESRTHQNSTSAGGSFTAPTSSSSSLNDDGAQQNGHGKQEDQTRPGSSANGAGQSKDKDKPDVFNFHFGNDTFTPKPQNFTKHSTDNINTRFVAEEEDATNWQFNAGSPSDGASRPTMPRSKSGSRIGRSSPFRSQSRQASFAEHKHEQEAADETRTGSFNAQEWTEKIGPHIFEPPPVQRTSTSPTRRGPTKKSSVRKTMGTAGMVDSDASGSGQEDDPNPPTAMGGAGTVPRNDTNSPNAMDIDSPPVHPTTNSARGVPVEPSRPEWRAGDVSGIKTGAKPDTGPQPAFVAPAGGSEDSEEFRTNFADFRNVEPFAEHVAGLESFADLKSNLPFESRASAHIPVKKEKPQPVKLSLPEPPQAPHPPAVLAVPNLKPSAMSWQRYVRDFHAYMEAWYAYNAKFSDHFQARGLEVQKKLKSPVWLEARDNSGIQEYTLWLEEDRQVRAKWSEACVQHENRVREFAVHRDRMLK